MLAAPNAGVAGAPKAPGLPNAGAPPKPAVGCDAPKAGAVDPNAGAVLTPPNAGCKPQRRNSVLYKLRYQPQMKVKRKLASLTCDVPKTLAALAPPNPPNAGTAFAYNQDGNPLFKV